MRRPATVTGVFEDADGADAFADRVQRRGSGPTWLVHDADYDGHVVRVELGELEVNHLHELAHLCGGYVARIDFEVAR